MIRKKLAELLMEAAKQAQEKGKLPLIAVTDVALEHSQNPEYGDYASSFPLKLARVTGLKPLTIANEMVGFIESTTEIDNVTVAPPGFINFTLKRDWLTKQIDLILEAGDAYASSDLGRGSRVQLEFVSVNPTGPLHVGHGRGAILGSTLANALSAAGYVVEKEYYINDAGNQIDSFYRSLYVRYQQCFNVDVKIPADGYLGGYILDLARDIMEEEGDRFLKLAEPEAVAQLGQLGLQKVLKQIRDDLEVLGVTFDVWFSERSLFQNGQYKMAMSLLEQGGHITEREGAIWFISTALGEDKDNVVVRSDGSPTYFASDIAYHYEKFVERKFDKVINIWGADHQGHISRMQAVIGALGINPERLQVIISQMVTLRRGDELVRISKRSGDIITLREVIEEVGSDACRFFFLSRTANSQMDFDIELAKRESPENPVYYVQYAHARIASILRLAQEKRITYRDGNVSLLTTEPELTLIRKMLLLPEIVETIATTMEPHHLAYYAQDLAAVFHSFYKQCRVISQDEPLSKARLKLVIAAKLVLGRALSLMGMTVPEQM